MPTREFLTAKVFTLLRSKQPRTLAELLNGLEVSRATGLKIIHELESNQLIKREQEIYGKGRPRALFYTTKNFERMIEFAQHHDSRDNVIVSIPLSVIRNMCRYYKGGMCKALETRLQPCTVELCPFINKIKV
jgi:predicted ArsR family transcriptional regulator